MLVILSIYGTIIIMNLLIALTVDKVDPDRAEIFLHMARIDELTGLTFAPTLFEYFAFNPNCILVEGDKTHAEPPRV